MHQSSEERPTSRWFQWRLLFGHNMQGSRRCSRGGYDPLCHHARSATEVQHLQQNHSTTTDLNEAAKVAKAMIMVMVPGPSMLCEILESINHLEKCAVAPQCSKILSHCHSHHRANYCRHHMAVCLQHWNQKYVLRITVNNQHTDRHRITVVVQHRHNAQIGSHH